MEKTVDWIKDHRREGHGEGGSERRFAQASEEACCSCLEAKLESLRRALEACHIGADRTVLGRALWHTRSRIRQRRMRMHRPRLGETGSEVASELGGLRGECAALGLSVGRMFGIVTSLATSRARSPSSNSVFALPNRLSLRLASEGMALAVARCYRLTIT